MDWSGSGKLAVVSRPAPESIDIELAQLAEQGYDTLVSLLSEPEVAELGLGAERPAAEAAGLKFEWLPLFDYSVPESQGFRDGLFQLHDRFRGGGNIAAHCRASVGRSPLLIASIMVLDGASPEDAWSRISRARGVPVPDTDAQRAWVRSLSARG